MRIGIYNEPSGAGLGGAEYLVAMIAQTLRERNDVEILHHHRGVDLAAWSAFSGTALRGVRARYCEPELIRPPSGSGRKRWQSFQEPGGWEAELSRPYDLFIAVTHNVPPFCHARAGVLIVLFPLAPQADQWPWSEPVPSGAINVRHRLRRRFYDWKWRRRFDSYQSRLAISEFSRKWTQEYWGLDCRVLYPAVETRFAQRPKKNHILSVGRFSLAGRTKNHDFMLKVFADLADLRQQGWHYHSLGGLHDSTTDTAYFESLQQIASACGAEVMANLERERLVKEYEEAKVFWHAAGYGQDDRHPVAAEHFGITTVEAMATGCVPVVIDMGGQSEIVEHGVNGFLWSTPEQLKAYTRQLVSDDPLRVKMSAAARERARFFGCERFVQRFRSLSPEIQQCAGAYGSHASLPAPLRAAHKT